MTSNFIEFLQKRILSKVDYFYDQQIQELDQACNFAPEIENSRLS